MSGVKNIIQQKSAGKKVPSNEEYREVGTNKTQKKPTPVPSKKK